MEEFSVFKSLTEFKENYKSYYYNYYRHENPSVTFLSYLSKLITFYHKEETNRAIHINKNKNTIPDWIITDEEKDLWYKNLDFDRELKKEFCDILYFLYEEREIVEGEQNEIKNLIPNIITNQNIKHTSKTPSLKASQKIKVKGSLQSIGYIFSELVNKGYIDVPMRNGNYNKSKISRSILEHFEFIDRDKQPTPEDIRQTLFDKNSLSAEKQKLFKIPESKIINTD